MKTSIILAFLVVGLLSMRAYATAPTNETIQLVKTPKEKYAEVVKKLEVFGHTDDVAELSGIPAMIEGIWDGSRTDGANWKECRRLKTQAWFLAFDMIDKNMDKNFIADDMPYENMAPPIIEGEVYDSGISPDAIKNPKIRQEYENALKLNAEKVRQHSFQTRLRFYDGIWTEYVKVYIENQYSVAAKGDIDEINALVDANILKKARKEKIKKALLEK
jgi:hypothetical protein